MGSTRHWVRSTASDIAALVDNTKLSHLFRPLFIFRDAIVTTVSSYVVGAAAFFAVNRLVSDSIQDDVRRDRVKHILGPVDLAARFERYVRETYSTRGSFWLLMVAFMLPWVAFLAARVIAERYLAYLVPRSGINIGLSSRRYKDYLNVFKFIVFTVLVGTLLAVIANILSAIVT